MDYSFRILISETFHFQYEVSETTLLMLSDGL